MPNSKSNHGGNRRMGSVEEKGGNRGGGSSRARSSGGKSSSFNGRSVSEGAMAVTRLHRPKTVNDLRRGVGEREEGADERPRLLTKLLLNVTIQGSMGPVHVVMRPESTAEDLIAMAVARYVKEGRRPVPPTKDPAAFDLHYSQFSLESIAREEKLMNMGSRNFFLYKKRSSTNADRTCLPESRSRGWGCSKEAENPAEEGFNWLRFMELLL